MANPSWYDDGIWILRWVFSSLHWHWDGVGYSVYLDLGRLYRTDVTASGRCHAMAITTPP